MSIINNKTKKIKFKPDLYKEVVIWKATFQVAFTGFIMALFLGLFTFVDQLMLVNFMPNTQMFSFDHLFFHNDDTFSNILAQIKLQNVNLYNFIISNAKQNSSNNYLYDLVYSIGNLNGLGIYNSDSIVRSAVSLTVALSDIVFVLPELFSIGVSIFYGYALGHNNKEMAKEIWRNGFYGTLILTFFGVIIIYIMIPFVTPAQAVLANITSNDIKDNIQELQDIITSAGYSTNAISVVDSNFNETIKYIVINGKVNYYLELNNNAYLKLDSINESLLSLTKNNINDYITSYPNQQDLSSFTLSSSLIMNNWNHYFELTRKYSINWAENFLYIINSGLIVLCLTSLFGTILRADGILHITTGIVITAVILNIIFDYVLIVYAQIGMDGAGVASIFGWIFQLVIFIILMHFIRTKKYLNKKRTRYLATTVHWTDLKIPKGNFNNFLSLRLMWKLILNGGAVFIGSVMYMISDILLTNQITYVATQLIGTIGSEYYLSILGAILPIINLFISAILGLLQYTAPIFSINYAAKNYKRFQHGFWWATFYTVLITTILYIIICFIPTCTDGILSWFNITYNSANNELISSVKLLRIWFLQAIAFAIAIGNYLVYLSSNRVGLAALFNGSRGIVVIVVLYIFSFISIHSSSNLNSSLDLNQINNPYTNNAMWFFMWNAPVGNLISGLFMFVCSIWYIYKNIPTGKKSLKLHYPLIIFYKNKLNKKIKTIVVQKDYKKENKWHI